MNNYWEWALSGDDDEFRDLRGIGFYANKFIVFVFDINTTGRNWNERKETYSGNKKQYGARDEILKYPIKKTKKICPVFNEGKEWDFEDYIVEGSIDYSYVIAPT